MPTQVDYDPFAAKSPSASAGGTPVDHDPFANKPETKKMGWWEGLGYEVAGVGLAATEGLDAVVKAAGISPFGERGDIGGDIGTAVAHPINTLGQIAKSVPDSLNTMFMEPKTPEEAVKFGETWTNVLGGVKGIAEGVGGAKKIITGIKDANEGKRIAGVQAQTDVVRAKAQTEHKQRQEEIQQQFEERKKSIANEHAKRVRELQTGSEALPPTTAGEPKPSVPSAKEVEAKAKADKAAHDKTILDEYARRKEAIANEIHRTHVEAEEAMQAEMREAELDAERSIREAEQVEKGALKGVRGEAAAKIRKARADYRAHQKKVATAAEAASDLPASDIVKDSPKGTLGRDMRARFLNGFRDALRSKRTGGKEFGKYLQRGRELENNGQPFIASDSGRSLINYLRDIANPPPGAKVTKFSVEFRNAAKRLENNLRGQVPRDGELLDQPAPLSIDAIDEELRNLRALENRTDLAGSDAIQRGRAKTLADHLENSMINWVGEEHYPRAYYAAMSEDFNKFQRPLFQNAVGRVELDYHKPNESPFKVTSKNLEGKVFGSAESVKEAKAFMGDQELDQFASRHVSNELYGKDAKSALRWWDDARKNGWIKETPEINNMTRRYVESLAQQEGDIETLGALDKARKAAVEEAHTTVNKATTQAAAKRAQAELAAKTTLERRSGKASQAKETAQTQERDTAMRHFKEATTERDQNLEQTATALENSVKEAKQAEAEARKQLERAQKAEVRQNKEAKTAQGEAAGAARKKALAQYKDAVKEAKTATEASEAKVKETDNLANAMFSLLAGERPGTMIAKFDRDIAPMLRKNGISETEIDRFKQSAISLDKQTDKIARNKKIKRFLWGAAASMLGLETISTIKSVVNAK